MPTDRPARQCSPTSTRRSSPNRPHQRGRTSEDAARAPARPTRGPSRQNQPCSAAMFTAIGGLKNHQVMLDVTANNIANVNTVGYKSQRVAFESMMSQTMRGASAPHAGHHRRLRPDPGRPRRDAQLIQSRSRQGSLQTTGQWNDLATPRRRLLRRLTRRRRRPRAGAEPDPVHARRQLHRRHERRPRHPARRLRARPEHAPPPDRPRRSARRSAR